MLHSNRRPRALSDSRIHPSNNTLVAANSNHDPAGN
jgi:hypothetical protein